MKKILFLDLEETVINCFTDFKTLINVEEVKTFIHSIGFDEVRIFSFAIWEDKDVDRFFSLINPLLAKCLDVTITVPPIKVCEIRKIVEKAEGCFFEFDWEFSTTFRKDLSFMKMVEHTMENVEVTLLDDKVANTTICNHDKNIKMNLINVNSLFI